MSTTENILNEIEKFKASVLTSLPEICDLDVTCKAVIEQLLKDIIPINQKSTAKIQAVIDYMYEQVNIGNWREVRLYLRKTLTITTYIRLIAYLKLCESLNNDVIREALKITDFGIIFGCPIEDEPKLLQNCASLLHSASIQDNSEPEVNGISVSSNANHVAYNIFNCNALDVINRPSMELFFTNYISADKPIVLDNCISHWPAMTKWQDQNYFIKLAGLRTVSIELGRDYTDSRWTQKLMTLEEFIRNHVYDENGMTGYLAQYQLFDQIPELRNDIIEPEYCYFSDETDEREVDIMAWYGPKGTVSPLHHDPKNNLLAQVVGQKLIFLFSPQETENLYPHEHELLGNTARVDPRQPDFEKYPKYRDVKGYYCILKAGQMLYIPPTWWHFVESLSVSFSVSFWWE